MLWRLAAGLTAGYGGWVLPALLGQLLSVLGVTLLILRGHLKAERRSLQRERRCRKELESYLRLDCRVGRGSSESALAQRVCSTVSANSPFRRVAVLLRDADTRLYLAASVAMEPQVLEWVRRWAAYEQLKDGRGRISAGVGLGAHSTVVGFGDGSERGIVVPFLSGEGRMSGALVVMAASVLDVRREMAEEAVSSLEALATRVACPIDGAAAAAIEERPPRGERLPLTEEAMLNEVA